MELNYYNTLIEVAADCPVTSAVVPSPRGGQKTVAVIQYELLAENPYFYTQEDVLFETYARHKGVKEREREAHGAEMRQAFFAKSQPCLRCSPLPKKYGWGLHFDSDGKVALVPLESEAYQHLASQEGVTVVKAMRSSRA